MGNIDLGYLEDITGGDNEIMVEMINLILTDTPQYIENIRQAYQDKKWGELSSESHKLKPMLLYIGLTELNEITQRLEQYGKQAEGLDSIPGLIKKLDDGFHEVVDDLRKKKTLLLA